MSRDYRVHAPYNPYTETERLARAARTNSAVFIATWLSIICGAATSVAFDDSVGAFFAGTGIGAFFFFGRIIARHQREKQEMARYLDMATRDEYWDEDEEEFFEPRVPLDPGHPSQTTRYR